MTRQLDVLLLENRPGVGETERTVLEEAGHRVHRCRPAGDAGFACVGMVGDCRCPLDGSIDVALLVRHGVSPHRTEFEDGVRCAIRRDVPIVEHGTDVLDPFEPWIAHRIGVGESVVTECIAAAERNDDPLRETVAQRIRPVLDAAGIRRDEVACRIERTAESLEVHVDVPVPPDHRLEQAIAVRVLDAVRGSRRTYGQVGVQVHTDWHPASVVGARS